MKRSLTEGSVFGNLVYFSLPYLISFFLQTLYGMADLFIIGQFNDTGSTTGVSIGSQAMHLLTVMIVGLAMGSTVLIGKAVGEANREKVSKIIGNTVTMMLTFSLVLTALLLLLCRPIIFLLQTPPEAIEETRRYMTVCFLGIPFITAYNIISSIFRGLGDSKTPMYFVAAACAVNIGLDYLFIGALEMGAMGAALGTTLSQTFSVLISLTVIARRRDELGLRRGMLRLEPRLIRQILTIGIPVAAQDVFIQVSFISITVFANRRGLDDAAAVGIVEKLIGMFFLIPSSMLSAVSVITAQCIGAGRSDRVRKTVRYAIFAAVSFGIVSSASMLLFAEPVVSLFTDSVHVSLLGGQYMRGYIFDCLFAGIHFCFSGYFCACGRSVVSFIHNCASIVLVRVPVAYFASVLFTNTLFPMGLASTLGSILSVVICTFVYIRMNKDVPNKLIKNCKIIRKTS